MTAATPLIHLIETARRRAIGNLVWEQLTVGGMAALGGAILLLLLGTQILDWWWPLALFVIGAGLSAWRTMRLLPSPYEVAQTIDRRLDLHDAVSTAYHFLEPAASARRSPELVSAQKQRAEENAAAADPAVAVPWRAPRHLWPALALAGIAATLFLVRYGLSGSLDLKSPMVEAVVDFFQPGRDVAARNKKSATSLPGEEPLAVNLNQPEAPRSPVDPGSEDALQVVDTPDVNVPMDPKDAADRKATEMKAGGEEGAEDTEGSEGDRGKGGDDGKQGEDASKEGSDGSKQGGAQNAKQGGDSSSLMDKMRDAMANLMAKLKIPQQAGNASQQQSSNQKGGPKQGSQEAGSGQKGEKGQGQPQGKGSPSDDANAEGQQGEQQAQAGQGKSNDKGQEGGSPNESKSGMGKQDGSKEIKDAEQVAAMGKISEIFGKRAQNITGEVMVEVSNGKQQQLRTSYTQRGAEHKDTGGEIHRDEVPRAYQHYVQQYFEQVRKGEAAPAAAAPAAAPASRQ